MSAAPPEKVWGLITDASRVPEWFWGAKDVKAGEGWPNVGSTISFRAGGSKFEGRVAESKAPNLLVLDIDTPSARSRVTSRIDAVGSGARYQRIVDAEWKGAMGPLFGKLFIGPAVKREAKKIAAIAEK